MDLINFRLDEQTFLFILKRGSELLTFRIGNCSLITEKYFNTDFVILDGNGNFDIKQEYNYLSFLSEDCTYIALNRILKKFKTSFEIYDSKRPLPQLMATKESKKRFYELGKLFIQFTNDRNIMLCDNEQVIFDYNIEKNKNYQTQTLKQEVFSYNHHLELHYFYGKQFESYDHKERLKNITIAEKVKLTDEGIDFDNTQLRVNLESRSMQMIAGTENFINVYPEQENALLFTSKLPLNVGSFFELDFHDSDRSICKIQMKVFAVIVKNGLNFFLCKPTFYDGYVQQLLKQIIWYWGVAVAQNFTGK